MSAPGVSIEPLAVPDLDGARDGLVRLLRDCVHGGASLGFLAPLSVADAVRYWYGLGQDLRTGVRVLLVARSGPDARIVGSGQIEFAGKPNARHRAEISKVMVAPDHRGRGIATAIMEELEARARTGGIRLLYLDTSEGQGGARRLYERLGWSYAGGIPGFALDPDGTPARNAIFYKMLG